MKVSSEVGGATVQRTLSIAQLLHFAWRLRKGTFSGGCCAGRGLSEWEVSRSPDQKATFFGAGPFCGPQLSNDSNRWKKPRTS